MLAVEGIMRDVGDSYVYRRDNGEYALSQVWPTKYNEQFKQSFTCSTTNPDPRIFHPQALAEFKRTINKLFGPSATERVPIVFAQNAKPNREPVYKGSAEHLERYLRSNPAAVDRLKIAKLYPGGFVATVSVGGNPSKGKPPTRDSFMHFDFTPGEEYAPTASPPTLLYPSHLFILTLFDDCPQCPSLRCTPPP